jgi:hypothetical protein
VNDKAAEEISTKLNVIIALLLRQLIGDRDFSAKKRKQGTGDIVRYLASLGLDAKNIADVTGSPLASVRTLLTPTRRK